MTTLPPPTPPTPPMPPAPRPPLARGVSRRTLVLGALGAAGASCVAVLYASGRSARSTGATPTMAAPTTTSPGAVTATVTDHAPTSSDEPAAKPPTVTIPTPPASDRVLVVLQLSGGNDALNTLVPVTGAYHDARPSIGLPDDTLLALPGTSAFGLHPAFGPMSPLIAAGHVGIVAGIGFEHPDRSHFASLDTWWAGRPDDTAGPGWLGRWLDSTARDDDPVLRAVGLGGNVPALRADVATSVAVAELEQFSLDPVSTDPALGAAWASLAPEHATAFAATRRLADLAAGLPAASGLDSGDVTRRLRIAAALIAAEPDARVVHVTVSGFDTHANQLDAQQRLLTDLAAGIAEFQAAITATGNAARTLLVTTSEFGRRIVENGSGGTDHGKAGVQFVVGDAVAATAAGSSGGVFGALDPGDPVDGDLRPVVDPRSLYATALDWLGGGDASATDLSDAVLRGRFERLPFITAAVGP